MVTGKIIAPMGGQQHVNFEHLDYPKIEYIEADTRDEMRKAIRVEITLRSVSPLFPSPYSVEDIY